MSRTLLLRIAAFLVLFTCAGHTMGTFMPVPPEQTRMLETIEIMKGTMIPMPLGSPKSYWEVFHGNNVGMSLFLLVTGIAFILLSRAANNAPIEVLLSLGMLGLCVISALYFFPVPAICTGVAGLLGIAAAKK